MLKKNRRSVKRVTQNRHEGIKRQTGSGKKNFVYLGRKISKGKKGLADKNIETIKLYKKPRIVKEMMGYLGTMGFCSEFITEYAEKVKELREMMKRAGMKDLRAELKWTDEGNEQFENIKKEVIMVTRTAMINYDQPFYVVVAMKKGGLATAVLFQGEGKYKRALGWYSTYLQGLVDWTDCEKNLEAVFWAYHKVSKLTLGGRVEIRSTHEVMGIIEQARFNLSVGRRVRYLELLEKHNLTVRIIKTKNEANRLLFCDEGEPHCCEDEGIRDMQIRLKM